MMRSPSSIMLKSVIARPTSRHRRFSSLYASRWALVRPLVAASGAGMALLSVSEKSAASATQEGEVSVFIQANLR